MELLPFSTPAFSVGLTIFCVVPTTLGVGVALTQASKGNQALALCLTVLSNLLGVVTVPFLLKMYLQKGNISVNPKLLAFKLALTGNEYYERLHI